MTREEAIKGLQEALPFDEEAAHTTAAEILCRLLTTLGYDDVVDEYQKIDKWYS